MKFLIVFVALFALALAAPAPDAEIIKDESDVGPESHNYSFKTSDGIEAESQGQLNNQGTDHESYVHKGSYEFKADDGNSYKISYIADENGFQPQGAHLPVAPK